MGKIILPSEIGELRETERLREIGENYRHWREEAGWSLYRAAAKASFPRLVHPSGLAAITFATTLPAKRVARAVMPCWTNCSRSTGGSGASSTTRPWNALDVLTRQADHVLHKKRRTHRMRYTARSGRGLTTADLTGEHAVASLCRDPGSRFRICFQLGGRRRTLRLGRVSRRQAEVARQHVEAIITAKRLGTAVPPATASWLASLDPSLKARLARCGLADGAADVPTLAEWCRQYVESRRGDAAERTLYRLESVAKLLCEHFGPDKPLSEITAYDAEQFSRWDKLGQALNTIRRRLGTARQILGAAARAGLLAANPFRDIPVSTRPNRKKDRFVTQEEYERLLDAAPSQHWRTLLALCRIGGLRPGEATSLTWDAVLWDSDRLLVLNLKTHKATGEKYRAVPLFPELRRELAALFDLAVPGEKHLFPQWAGREVNLRRPMNAICRRAGIPPFRKPYCNLRASRATELVEEFPSHVVNSWLGHGERVATRHYRLVTEEHF
ncbi:MAG: tyrosine-type recombinase/integrase [Gemmatales bacterium]|nr:tyrosine-type recombinase/integrase [Gemmatales bacterium]MDW8386433.1 tyrosine-type recombinase/integrase [Gemmatales bacterium]